MIKKFNKSARTAISQIRKQNYFASLQQYVGDILLVGINYDKKTKVHTCSIDRITKSNTKGNLSVLLSPKQRRVVTFCAERSHTATEIFKYLGVSKQAKHYDIYINVLLANGVLIDVTPEKQRGKSYRSNKVPKKS